ncbi:MAG: GH10 [uncultured Thermomicrobiales bacterium]|uniref:endo-1,4-beta-xylanase n=1 Tax=uncultured Thermomicrobiales bacterium TaxID=1645740 RepID=A0A6J4VUI7_9BACT|nr:MAG: GH10 [uncultured Thermomicrobiales bacterium]
MGSNLRLTRRSALRGATGAVALGLVGPPRPAAARDATPAGSATPGPEATPLVDITRVPLWRPAADRGIIYGTSLATWQLDPDYAQLVNHEAAILFTEDDLLWYKLRPMPGAELDFQYGDQFVALAERQRQLVFGAHLVWDEGFGEGWTEDDLWGMDEATARNLLFDTVEAVVDRYRGRVAGWVVVNEVIDAHEADGLRRDYPWYETIGPTFIAESFQIARAADPDAVLVLNEFGFETDDEFDRAADKREKALIVLDALLAADVPVDAFGVQAHLEAGDFAARFDPDAYRQFLADLADRGVKILITEMDVLDDGLPADIETRDAAVADTYARYLDVALDEPAVVSLMTFGLTDRYTWLQEDYPRGDGAERRPLPLDSELRPKPAYDALLGGLEAAAQRDPLWRSPRSE